MLNSVQGVIKKEEIVEKVSAEMTVEEFSRKWTDFQNFVNSQLVDGTDYGKIPGIPKPFLMLPGAEKICSRYFVRPEFEVEKIEDWDKGLFNYQIKCVLKHIGTGRIVGEGIGSCNSYEEKYRYIWVSKSKLGNKEVLETRGRKGKYGEYMEYKIKREDIATLVNTLLKMACKRAIVAASLILGNASGLFTQDIEDINIVPEEKEPLIKKAPEVKKVPIKEVKKVPVREGSLEDKELIRSVNKRTIDEKKNDPNPIGKGPNIPDEKKDYDIGERKGETVGEQIQEKERKNLLVSIHITKAELIRSGAWKQEDYSKFLDKQFGKMSAAQLTMKELQEAVEKLRKFNNGK